jgi:predicted esterase
LIFIPGKLLLLAIVVIISGCHIFITNENVKNRYLLNSGFKPLTLNVVDFNLEVWGKFSLKSKTLVIYIEGDGNAWQTRFKLSSDPTPRDPLALRLAVQDNTDNVLYLARPCQYQSMQNVKCQTDNKYWSSHRYSAMVLKTYHLLLDQLKQKFAFQQFHLIGYSGGGTIAALLAASRSDITELVTIASNLDHQNWTKFHNVSALSGSLNLYQYLESLSEVKQMHVSGKNDQIVPSHINFHLLKKLKSFNPKNIHQLIIEDYNHNCCWKDNWSAILATIRLKK